MHKEIFKKLLSFFPEDGANETCIPGVHIVKYSTPEKRTKRYWRGCFAIVLQGTKEVVLGREVFLCSQFFYTATPFSLPVVSRVVNATKGEPFVALLIDLDPLILNEVATLMDEVSLKEEKNPQRALFSGKGNEFLKEATIRLSKILHLKEEARVLGPLIIKEIFYCLLKSEEGSTIRQFVLTGSKMQKISKAIHNIKVDLKKEINVSLLAKKSSMSRSAFFKYFKEVTSMSPIQYQKRLRLLEAKRLMANENETAEHAAYLVGYKSASQFSREYSRMFGSSPRKDTLKNF